MALPPGTYDPQLVTFTFLGAIMTGYGEDTFLVVARNEDGVTLTMGAGGDGVRNINPNKSGTFTLTLLQSSPSNDLLMAAHARDQLTRNGFGPAMVKDLNGRSLAAARNTWVKKSPDISYGKEEGSYEWVLETDSLDIYAAGNNSSPVPV